jgi:hypothetical protein
MTTNKTIKSQLLKAKKLGIYDTVIDTMLTMLQQTYAQLHLIETSLTETKRVMIFCYFVEEGIGETLIEEWQKGLDIIIEQMKERMAVIKLDIKELEELANDKNNV